MGRASIKLYGLSALEYWYSKRLSSICPEQTLYQTLRQRLVTPRDCSRITMSDGAAPSDGQIEQLLAGPLRNLTTPLHIMVPSLEKRRNSQLKVCHVWSGALPRSSFVKIGKDLYASSPAFCFLQLASRLPLLDLIQLGNEFCGAYMPYEFDDSGIVRCPPLTDKASIGNLLNRLPDRRGIKAAMRALKYIVDNSASPKETGLEMLLCLPPSLGGYGIPVPEMNSCVDMAHAVQFPWDSDLCLGDLTWPEKRLVVDYNGEESHKGIERKERDDLRRNRLLSAGFKVIDAFKQHLSDPTWTDVLVGQVMRGLGRHVDRRQRTDRWACRSAALRKLVSSHNQLACQRILDSRRAE